MIDVSVIVPYWNRPEALAVFYKQVEDWHSDPRYEFIIVDDGSMKDPAFDGPPNVRVLKLPPKAVPKNPSVPMNRGVAESHGAVVVLTGGCEILHSSPDDLPRLVGLLKEKNDYAVAACFDTQRGWIQHTEKLNPMLHWFTAIHREWFDAVGGFDEAYREGYAFEDNDFVRRLEAAGTNFIVTNDIVVEHRSELQPGKLNARGSLPSNQALYRSKWPGH